ncbi:MAG: 3-deoxy-7-phosphoheptulonate synthase [Syntrophobacteraceae bacterium]|nr:3-deoxy-7-phosphoheptulonate synthase [Syntrophobacteraceae bacterium]
MLIVMDQLATPAEIDAAVAAIEARGYTARPIPGGQRVAIGVLHNHGAVDASMFLGLAGVKEVIPVTRPFKLVSREFQLDDTVVRVGDVEIGNGHLTMIAGPCAIESEEQALTIARHVRKAGAQLFRGGAFKPRTSPYAFQGLGVEGLRILSEIRAETGLPFVTEVMDTRDVEMVSEVADIIQVGARNMQNFNLLKAIGRCNKPVMIKRGLSSTLEELLMSAEYVMSEGNHQVILCERGIRTFEKFTRNTLDLSAIPVLKRESHLPVMVDPSHGVGHWDLVVPMARAAIAAGADGLMVEVHPKPEEAWSDGAQSLLPRNFRTMMKDLERVAKAVGRSI